MGFLRPFPLSWRTKQRRRTRVATATSSPGTGLSGVAGHGRPASMPWGERGRGRNPGFLSPFLLLPLQVLLPRPSSNPSRRCWIFCSPSSPIQARRWSSPAAGGDDAEVANARSSTSAGASRAPCRPIGAASGPSRTSRVVEVLLDTTMVP